MENDNRVKEDGKLFTGRKMIADSIAHRTVRMQKDRMVYPRS